MPVFAYEAVDLQFHRRSGVIEASSPRAARRLLLSRGIRVARLKEEEFDKREGPVGQLKHWGRRLIAIRQRERVLEAIESLVVMLESGVTLEAAWASLSSAGLRKSKTIPILHRLHDAVSMGQPLSQVMAENSMHFDRVDVALARAGEDSGELAAALERLVARRRLAGRLGATFLNAIAYPAFLLFFGCGVIVFLTGYVIPDINAMLIAGGGEVPMLTKTLQLFGWVLGVGLLPLIFAAILGSILIARYFSSVKFRIHRLLLRVPVVGSGWLNWQLSQFCLVLRTLVASGIQLPAALILAGHASGEGPVLASANLLRERLLEGHDLGQPPQEGESGLPPWLWHALAVGQATGDLVPVLERVGQRFEAAAMRSAARLGAVLEPAMILLVGIFVGLVAYAALLPIVRLGRLW